MISVKEAAKKRGVCPGTMLRYCQNGEVEAYKDRSWHVSESFLDKMTRQEMSDLNELLEKGYRFVPKGSGSYRVATVRNKRYVLVAPNEWKHHLPILPTELLDEIEQFGGENGELAADRKLLDYLYTFPPNFSGWIELFLKEIATFEKSGKREIQ